MRTRFSITVLFAVALSWLVLSVSSTRQFAAPNELLIEEASRDRQPVKAPEHAFVRGRDFSLIRRASAGRASFVDLHAEGKSAGVKPADAAPVLQEKTGRAPTCAATVLCIAGERSTNQPRAPPLG